MKSRNLKYTYGFVLLLIITVISFSPTFENDFTNWDDHVQVTNNTDITTLSVNNIKTIFSSFYVGMYQPITTLLFTIEHHFFGLNPRAFHSVSLIFHLLNIMLVFWFVTMLTKRKDLAFIVSSFFAVHPMFVEAISWVSARSTLVFASFYLSAIISYLYFLESKKKKFITLTFLFFLCSLLSKVMAITLPILLILFDFYDQRKLFSQRVIIEKTPFFIISFIFGIVSIYGRQIEGYLGGVFTLFDKLFIMSYQIVWYVFKFCIPIKLSAYYPNPIKINGFLPFYYYLSPLFFLFISFIIYKLKNYRKTIFLSLFFFLVHISLVLKIIQVGDQLTTDRYMYVAGIGLLLLFGYGYQFLIEKKPSLKIIAQFSILVVFSIFSYLSYHQTKIWKNSRTLWTQVIQENDKTSLAHTNLGVTYVGIDDVKAEKYFLKSIAIDSNNVIPYNNLGFIYLKQDKQKAEKYLFKAMEVDPTYLYIYTNLAQLFMNTDKEKAQKYILKAAAINANNFYVKQRIATWNLKWLNVEE